ncbi:hypothetical protein [Alistipes sp. ZOR0009]|uniref:hypothetical protein n=1 Tax=Alistipes sp. ZOR0009 TaxID=1339253 RepID=UPI000AECBAE6|nr:hypothetical protein [Alistipes sp. ZOR0009]
MGYLTYGLKSFQVRSVNLTSIVCRVGIDINNPSQLAVSLDDYRIEVYYIKDDNSRSLLASSPVSKLSISANQTTTITTDISIGILTLSKFVRSLTSKVLTSKGSMVDVITKEFQSKTVIVVKTTVLGQFITKEFKF